MVAVALVVWRSVWALVAGLVLVNGTLLGFGLARTSRGIFGFNESGFQPSPEAAISLIVEIGAAVVLLAAALAGAAPGAGPAAGGAA